MESIYLKRNRGHPLHDNVFGDCQDNLASSDQPYSPAYSVTQAVEVGWDREECCFRGILRNSIRIEVY